MARWRPGRWSLPFLMGVAALAAPSAAAAQPKIAGQFSLDRFEPTPIGDPFFGVQTGEVDGQLTPRGGIVFDYARDPLRLYATSGDKVIGSVVQDQFFMHFAGSLALFDRIELSLDFPLALVDDGQNPVNPNSGNMTTLVSPSGVAAGDLRIGARLNLFREKHDISAAAIGGYLWVPTGDAAKYTSDGKVRGEPVLSLGGRVGPLAYSGDAGIQIRSPINQFVDVNLGTEFDFGVAAGLLVANDNILIGPELIGSTVVDNGKGKTTDAELLGGVHFRLADFVIGAGAGPGLTRGVGTPSARVVGMLAYSPDAHDRDGDGIRDRDDACPDVPGVRSADPTKNGCPDRDGDGILDSEDACPDVPGVASSDPKKNGCPPDRDGDGIADAKDACPDVPGVRSSDPKK
ncbi:MAG TPA: thrombospondin type 3 repeat-containing protein, partial [Minicystis sp.]|nr:thrombospondin type 3 repeat-containing protein [Minicystis sp.]